MKYYKSLAIEKCLNVKIHYNSSRLENIDEFMSVPKDYEENTPLEDSYIN